VAGVLAEGPAAGVRSPSGHEPARRAAARQATWDRYLADIPHDELDMDAIVTESQLFTLADIEFAARRTAQLAFERVVFEPGEEIVTTGDIRHAISQTRRTLTRDSSPTSSRTSPKTPGYRRRHMARARQAGR
jgi:SpoVK/Ycf46/Vps4 family AAA+-type ATPase